MKGLNKELLFVLILLLGIVVPVMAGNQYIGVESVLSGINADPAHPALYLVDGKQDSYWGFKATEGQAWAEIRLEGETLVQALEINGYLAAESELMVEYYRDNHWLPFLAPTVNQLSKETLLDLSSDQIVTDRVRLSVSGRGMAASYLRELKLLGIPAAEYYHRIKPRGIEASANTDPVYAADFLLDGNTYTCWQTEKESKDWQDRKFDEVLEELSGIVREQNSNKSQKGNNSQQTTAEVEFDLGGVYTLDNIKLYLSNHSKGTIELHTYQKGNWQHLDSIDSILANNRADWYRLDLKDRNVSTDRIKLIVTGYGGELGGIGEVEFWGTGNYYGETPVLIGMQQPHQLDQAVNSQFELAADNIKEYTLELAVKENSAAALTVELNGKEISLKPAFHLRDYTVYKKKLTKENLWAGKNYLKVQPKDNLTLVNARLNNIKETNTDPELGDGRLFGPANNSSEITVKLDRQEISLPAFPVFLKPPYIPGSGSRKIENWNGPTVIDHDLSYDTLIVNTELQLDTSYGDISIIVKELKMGSNASISVTGPGQAYLYLAGDLQLSSGSRINGAGKTESLEIYHTGSRVYIEGGVGGQEQYKIAANLYTMADEVFIQNGASFKGKLYAMKGNITIRGGITASELIYAKTGVVRITGGARVNGQLISSGKRLEILGGSTFTAVRSGEGILAPEAEIYLDQGAMVNGQILANPERVHIGNINPQSCYKIPQTGKRENRYIEELSIYSREDNPRLSLYALVDNSWRELEQTALGLKSIVFKSYLKTDKLLIKNSQGIPLSELVVKYSSENQREPEVEILQPSDNQQLNPQELARGKIIAYVDNPDTEVTINGQQAYHRGHYFWLEANRCGASVNQAHKIRALARDNKGRVNYDLATIYLANQVLIDLNLSEGIFYTDQDSLVLSGSISPPLNQLRINGEEVKLSGQKFDQKIDLKPGLNLLKIEAAKLNWQGDPEYSRVIYRKVVRLEPLELRVDSPLDGYYTKADSIVVSGMVSGLGELTVSVNGEETVLEGGLFSSRLVELNEGNNTIKIAAANELGQLSQEIRVIKDTVAPVLAEISPADGYISPSSTLIISGQVSDRSPVQVYVNGRISTLTGSDFKKQLSFKDGQQQLTLRAIDQAGNESFYQFNVLVDTVPPAAFTVQAKPADWSANTQPVISFETSDQTSGISHYELKIDEGAYLEVASPYQLPVQPDGEHLVTVKAIDNAGLETVSSTRVYIDTTPPETPENLRVIPADGRITLKWDPSSEDVVEYQVSRNSGKDGGSDEQNESYTVSKEEFTDSNLTNGDIYSYRVVAIDRAANQSKATGWKTGIVGLAETSYDREKGALLEYDNLALALPKEQLPEEIDRITVTEISSAELEEEMIYPQVGPIYEISAYKEGSNTPEENMALENGYLARIKYEESQLPEGFPEHNLGVYHYDPMFGKWFKLPSTGVDVKNNYIYFITNHFSSFSVQSTIIQDLTAQEYKDTGYSPLKSYSKHEAVTVSPQFGTASTEATELVLPGRNGFDFVLKRRYDTATARNDAFALAINAKIGINILGSDNNVQDYDTLKKIVDAFKAKTNWANEAKKNLLQMLEKYLFNQGDFAYSTGQGWRLNIPYIKAANSTLILRTAEGSMHYINEMKLVDIPVFVPNAYRELVFEQHEGADFTLRVKQVYSPVDFVQLVGLAGAKGDPQKNRNAIKSRWYSSGYTLILKDGTSYQMDGLGRTTAMVDATGANKIEYHYDGRHLDYIKDSMGRKIRFQYRSDLLWPRIKKVWLENDPQGREIKYDVGRDNLLDDVQDVAGRVSKYKYDTRLLYAGEAGAKLNLGRLILKIIASELVGPAASIFGGADIELYGSLQAQLVFPLEEISAPGQGISKIKYRQATLMHGSCDIDWFFIIPKSITLSVELEQYLLTKRVEVYLDSSHKVRTTSYDYDFDYYKWQQPMNYQTVESDGQRETVYKYQPVVQKRYRWEDKSYDTKSGVSISFPAQLWTKHALGVLKSEEVNEAASGETLQRQEYQYDLKKMRPTKIKTIRGSSSNQESYHYDNWGNVIYYHNADNGLKRYRHYLNTNSSTAAFPAKFKTPVDSDFSQVKVDKHIHNLLADSFVLNQSPVGGSVPVQSHHVYSAVGKLVLKADWDDQQSKWLKSKFSYDQYGNLIKQIDPLGNLSEIEYDEEYSQAYPTKTIRKGQNGEAIKDVDGQAIAGEYLITQQGYYKSTGLKKWEIDANGALTEYQYDILGRLIKTIYPDDDDQYAGTIGSLKPANYSKRANNPVKIQYYNDKSYQTTVVNASEDLAVDDYKIRNNNITEPVYNKSRYHYDKLNRWVKLETFNLKADGSSEVLSSSFYYDQANRRTAVKDAEGYVSFTEYDPLDRETKIILADGSKDLANSKDNQLYTKLEYEQNQRTMIDAEGNKTEELKDWSGNLIRVNQYLRNEKISSSAQYDQLGNRVELKDAAGRITQYSYDSLGRLVEEILAEDDYIRPAAGNYDNVSYNSVRYKPSRLYFYDELGRKVKEISPNSNWLYGQNNNSAVSTYQYNAVGNLLQETDPAGEIVKHYYDRKGNEVKTIDQAGNIVQQEYTVRGWLKAEALLNGSLSNEGDVSTESGAHDLISYYSYNLIGQKTAVTTAQGVSQAATAGSETVTLFAADIYEHLETPYYQLDPNYTKEIKYDRLGRVIEEKRTVNGAEYITSYQYNRVGKKKEVINPEGQRTVYHYTPQHWLEEEISYDQAGKKYSSSYQYDKVGNKTRETDPAGRMTRYSYDQLNRLEAVMEPDGQEEKYRYDGVGNRTIVISGLGQSTRYEYNSQNQLAKVIDSAGGSSKYYYDPEGNLMEKVLPNGVRTRYSYDQRNLMVREIRPEGGVIKYSYDGAGNLIEEIDRKGQLINYSYRRDYLPLKIEYRDQSGEVLASKEYHYDKEGNRLSAVRKDGERDNSTITTSYNPLGFISTENRGIDGKSYRSSYRYDKLGKLSGIKYPGSNSYLEYKYNDLNHLVAVDGIADGSIDDSSNDLTFTYRNNGFLSGISYQNGTSSSISPDRNYRIGNIKIKKNNAGVTEKLLDISYNYDQNNNLIKRTDKLSKYTNQYHYDRLDRLVSTDLAGTFYGERTGHTGVAEEDQLRYKALKVKEDYLVDFDYQANSVGVILVEKAEIGKIVLTPAAGVSEHRVSKDTITVHYSDDNFDYYEVPKEDWEFTKDKEGKVTITFKESIPALAFKVHSNHDDRDIDNNYLNLSTFSNNLEEIVRVYQRSNEGKIEYSYDAGGNRTEKHSIVGNDDSTKYEYYPDTNRLKKTTSIISGKTYKEQYYIYDENGNLTAKGNEVRENSDGSLILDKDSPGSRYWEYEYTADNRLKAVYYKGELKVEYSYDADGKRIVSDTEEGITHFVFNYSGKVIYEESIGSDGENKVTSYVYALSKQLARVEGVIGGEGEVIYYHYDNLGSTRLMTDEDGEVVFDQDYLPFGGDLAVVGDLEPQNDVGESYKYTGQRQEVSIGFYYYGARFYDPGIGRFISEDSYAGELVNPQGQNIYVYVMNNPMKYVDPTGHDALGINAGEIINDYEELEKSRTISVGDMTFYGNYYNVQEGDTLSDITDEMYNTIHFNKKYSGEELARNTVYNLTNFVADINHLKDKDRINPGQELFFPDVFGTMHSISQNRYNKNNYASISLKGIGAYVGTKAGEATLITAAETAGKSIGYFKHYGRNGWVMTGIKKTFARLMKELPKTFGNNLAKSLSNPASSNTAIEATGAGLSKLPFSKIVSSSFSYGLGTLAIVIGETKPVGDKPINEIYLETPYTKYGIYMDKSTGRMRYLEPNIGRWDNN
ncbi:hypothetical protein GM661_03685 [Iocasia frigidifontis]|uniref:Fibronectin type-III domain-containing protein n=1 Tax=Iocasia fonsfrigidae TaxID=2682810 RepID=A0A8A7KC31_9FIRM|nr:RHS repeat-associated core domain-containing protein [Iocasia fonsfrigidae]QTL97138.1 hypothetical protein GM661_03685 [Iocasia fonsfrigidae]